VVVEQMGRGVLDTPHARGMTVEVRPTFDFNIRIFGRYRRVCSVSRHKLLPAWRSAGMTTEIADSPAYFFCP